MQFKNKIGPDGKYLPFPGVTVVAAIRGDTLPTWKALHTDLASLALVTEHYSLLPAESYHMTTADLFTFRDHGRAMIEQNMPMLRALHAALTEHAFEPRIVVESCSVLPNVIRLNLAFDAEQQAANKALFARFNLQDRIPAVFHITLAYSYRPTDEALREKIAAAVGAKISCIGLSFTLDLPELCYFNDMQAFFPWNATHFPW